MAEKFLIDYDYEEDLLYAYNPNRKSKGSVEFGELVIDLEKRGKIVGLEIFSASKYLSELTNRKLSKTALKNIEKASISFSNGKGTIIIKIMLPLQKETVPASIAIPNFKYKSPASKFAM